MRKRCSTRMTSACSDPEWQPECFLAQKTQVQVTQLIGLRSEVPVVREPRERLGLGTVTDRACAPFSAANKRRAPLEQSLFRQPEVSRMPHFRWRMEEKSDVVFCAARRGRCAQGSELSTAPFLDVPAACTVSDNERTGRRADRSSLLFGKAQLSSAADTHCRRMH